jgi:Zn-dependent M16 (insulinase) family peptidase
MRATKIQMKPNCGASNNLLEIDNIYLTGSSNDGYYKKAAVHDYLVKNPKGIQVNIYPYPDLIPMLSSNNEKYVKSTPDSTAKDNLLSLPRE